MQADLRNRLRRSFEQFLTDTDGIEAVWALTEILEIHFSDAEDLVEAISHVIEKQDTYIRVYYKDAEKVKEFAALLRKPTS